jgi:hypothetical protein
VKEPVPVPEPVAKPAAEQATAPAADQATAPDIELSAAAPKEEVKETENVNLDKSEAPIQPDSTINAGGNSPEIVPTKEDEIAETTPRIGEENEEARQKVYVKNKVE